jgi:hypothetical protein
VRWRPAAAVVALALLLLPAADATAQETPSGRIALASQPAWVPADGTFDLRLDVDRIRAPEELEVTATVHPAVTSRSQFARTLDGALLGRVIGRTSRPLTFDAAGAVPLTFSLAADPPEGSEPLPSLGPGVYPVAVSLAARDGRRVDGFTTHLVRVDAEADLPPLAVSWVQPLSAPPGTGPDGTISLSPATRSSLAEVAAALADPTVAPVSLAPTPETLEALGAVGDDETLDDLRVAVGDGGQVLARPYVDLSLAQLLDPDLGPVVAAQRERGAEVLEETLDRSPDLRTFVTLDELDAPGLRRLQDLGVERLVVAEDELLAPPAGATGGLTLARPFVVDSSRGRGVVAAAVDPALAGHFGDPTDQVLAAHHLLADLAVIFGDTPALRRGVVVHPPRGWRADPSFLATALAGLTSIPALEAVTLDHLLTEVPLQDDGGSPLVRQLSGDGAGGATSGREELLGLHADVGSLVAMADGTSPEVEALERVALVAASDRLTPAERRAFTVAGRARIAGMLDRVGVLERDSHRLTAREGTIPLTLRNENPFPVEVFLSLASDKLEFARAAPSDPGRLDERLDLPPGNTAVSVRVRTRTSGDFPLLIGLRSPDGRLDVGQSRVTIRSTVASGVGVVLSAGAGLFLAVWWARHWRTVRRDRRLVDAPAAPA